ncbi:MAG: thermonuclease family protein [Pseudomonadota bacterium]
MRPPLLRWRHVVLLALHCGTALAGSFDARVVGVTDGDTLTVLDAGHRQWKIRLAGIDAPEKRQAFGQQSKQALADRVFDRHVVIDAGKTDRYGRTVGKVIAAGEDVNLELVRKGLAWHYKKYEREQSAPDRLHYARAEQDARRNQRGLWQQPEPVAPWDYRLQKRER